MSLRCLFRCCAILVLVNAAHAGYLVGVGKSDITGPVADVNLMGYAMPLQIARGIHTRLYARAYVFAEPDRDRRRFAYVVSDACMSSQLVTMRVIQKLQGLYGDLYTADNVLLSGTHTHASPAGFLQYLLYSVTSLGFVRDSFDALVDGITEAIQQAHESLGSADISWASGELLEANINRSPTAYLANPPEERAQYQHDVDKTMDVLRITRGKPTSGLAPQGLPGWYGAGVAGLDTSRLQGPSSGKAAPTAVQGSLNDVYQSGLGMISWFPVHCTSMNNTNPFVSGDNKGAAAQFTERAADKGASVMMHQHSGKLSADAEDGALTATESVWHQLLKYLQELFSIAGHLLGWEPCLRVDDVETATEQSAAGFVAAFAQSSVGDTSPNVMGAYCLDTGEPCEMSSSTCGGRNELCVGRGPAWPDDTASSAIIARRQADKAAELWQQEGVEVTGSIDYRHAYINMSGTEVLPSKWTRGGHTCPPAMGFSFAAGTTDGPGAFDFTQGDTAGGPFWRLVRDLLSTPSAEQVACHAPKPILLNTGYMNIPYPWQPHITEMSLVRLGNLVLIGVPGEFSTMAGRRIKAAVTEVIGNAWGHKLKVVLSGLSGTYSSYITTYEEYQVQRYEGASTAHGPHTLDAYIQTAVTLVKAMLAGEPVTSTVAPPDLESSQISLLTPVVMDGVPLGADFGDVVVQPLATYTHGQTAEAVFRSGCPRNNLRRGGTFMAVQRLESDSDTWVDVAMDSDWETHFYWERHWKLSTQSFATLRWSISSNAPEGMYRLVHYGDWKPLLGAPRPFVGITNTFTVVKDTTGMSTAPKSATDLISNTPSKVLYKALDVSAQSGLSKHANRWKPTAKPCSSAEDPLSLLLQPAGDKEAGLHVPVSSQQPQRSTAAHLSLSERWSALSSLYEPGMQYQTRFGCGQHYTAWWRGEGGCGQAELDDKLMHYCTYGTPESTAA